MKISFLDLKGINNLYRAEIGKAHDRVMDSGRYLLGAELEGFENEFARYCDSKYCIGVGSGLDALSILLHSYGIGKGDEVIVPSNTFIATWLAVSNVGAVPVPVEPDEKNYNITPEGIEAAITSRTTAIIPVHLYGHPANMDTINHIAAKNKLLVIEDAAQAHGATYKGRKTGSLGNAAATSFYPGKNLGALSDGGAILTDDPAIAEKSRKIRNYGSSIKYQHELIGTNSRLDEFQSAVLRIKLADLDRCNANRQKIADAYRQRILSEEIILPFTEEWATSSWHLYVIRSSKRNQLQNMLSSVGIETMIHYPTPPHMQACYRNTRNWGLLSLTEKLSEQQLSLPISPQMSQEQADYVIAMINELSIH